jgi:hypothetical protein
MNKNPRYFLYEQRLKQWEKSNINAMLAKAGFDGNGRFERPDKAMTPLQHVLDEFNLDISEPITPWTFTGNSGRRVLDVEFHNTADPFSPVSLDNSALVITYYKHREGAWEVLAYMS